MEYDNEKRLVAWEKTSRNGSRYLSVATKIDGVEYSGVLFFEKEKKSENSPDLTGKLEVKGQREASTDTGYEKAKQVAQEIKAKQVDEVAEVDDTPISLDDIPF
jgi:hypothetical protein